MSVGSSSRVMVLVKLLMKPSILARRIRAMASRCWQNCLRTPVPLKYCPSPSNELPDLYGPSTSVKP